MTERDGLELLRSAGASVEGPSPAARVRGRALLEDALRTAPARRGSLALRISSVAVAAVLAAGIVFGLGFSRTRLELGDVGADIAVHELVTRTAVLGARIAEVQRRLGRDEPSGQVDSDRARLRKLKRDLDEACARIQSLPPDCG